MEKLKEVSTEQRLLVLGGVAVGVVAGLALAHVWRPAVCSQRADQRNILSDGGGVVRMETLAQTQGIWNKGFQQADAIIYDFANREVYHEEENPEGHVSTLEKWDAGSRQESRAHSADSMVVVVEGSITVQLFTRTEADGERTLQLRSTEVYSEGHTAYIKANEVHSVAYDTDCKIVRVHDGPSNVTDV